MSILPVTTGRSRAVGPSGYVLVDTETGRIASVESFIERDPVWAAKKVAKVNADPAGCSHADRKVAEIARPILVLLVSPLGRRVVSRPRSFGRSRRSTLRRSPSRSPGRARPADDDDLADQLGAAR